MTTSCTGLPESPLRDTLTRKSVQCSSRLASYLGCSMRCQVLCSDGRSRSHIVCKDIRMA
eukprot:1157487-Pelagomonas_calceolata.AAC.4